MLASRSSTLPAINSTRSNSKRFCAWCWTSFETSRLRRLPGHQLMGDLLAEATFDRQRLTVRQRLLERQALLEDIAIADALKELARQIPAGPWAIAGQLDERRLAFLMMLFDRRDPVARLRERIAVGGQHEVDVQRLDPVQRLQIVIERIGA